MLASSDWRQEGWLEDRRESTTKKEACLLPTSCLASLLSAHHARPRHSAIVLQGIRLSNNTKKCAGFPWPNPDCPVALVECDHGQEVRGDLSRQTSALATESLQAGATSYCNLVEASLAIRSGTATFGTPRSQQPSHSELAVL